jgi:uncharacterized protein (TIGR02246 family)
MKLIALALACASGCFGFATASRAQILGAPQDVVAIEAVIAEMTDAFNKHDAVAASRMYTPDAEFTNVAGRTAKGSAEIEKFLAAGFATRLKASTQKTMNVTIRFIRPDVAIAHITNEITGFLNADGSTESSHRELSIRVFQKEDGIWRVGAFHNTTVATPKGN